MNSGAIWNDKPCEASQAYVCECDGALLEVPPTWCVTDLDTSCDTCTDDCTLQGNTCSADQVCS